MSQLVLLLGPTLLIYEIIIISLINGDMFKLNEILKGKERKL